MGGTICLVDEKAGFWRRFAAALIDGIVLSVVTVIFRLFLGTNGGSLVGLAISAVYFGYFHGGTGQTPGDAVMSIRVVDAGGGDRVGWGRALWRWLVSYASGFALLIGYLWMIWDGEKQTWHDKAARTYVVHTA
jgi:uncharacterized RDD family membrane protein YckC